MKSIAPKPPLAVHFIWNYADTKSVSNLLDEIRIRFARHPDFPFSRSLNIPLFFYSSDNAISPPQDVPEVLANKNIIFVFTSKYTVAHTAWNKYIAELPNNDYIHVICAAVDSKGIKQNIVAGSDKMNFLRLYEYDDLRQLKSLIALSHEIYRFGCKEIDPNACGNASSLRLFLSHAKRDGVGKEIAEAIRDYINTTNMQKFYDAIDIAPGFNFGEEIRKHVDNSTMIVISSDDYSSRYWCQKEVLLAKELNRPMIVVDCLKEYEDRVFPAKTNVPCVHVPTSIGLNNEVVLRVLLAAILETIRCSYSLNLLSYYRVREWISKDCYLSSRPPEALQILRLKEKGVKEICYPEPSLYREEIEWAEHYGLCIYTPIMPPMEKELLKSLKLGISISEVPPSYFSSHHQHAFTLKRLSQDLARYLLSCSGTIVYGGDLRNDGFTKFILDEALVLQDRLSTQNLHVENHLAWPIYLQDSIIDWIADYSDVIHAEKCPIPEDIKALVDEDVPIAPDTPKNRYIWSRALTKMREGSIKISDVRICAGGKLEGYLGKMPGVLEEILISLEMKKPLFLLGGFGGVVAAVCKSLITSSIATQLTEIWQLDHNPGYAEFQVISKENEYSADFEKLRTILENTPLQTLADRCGLDLHDYEQLMETPFVDVSLYFIMKGLRKKYQQAL